MEDIDSIIEKTTNQYTDNGINLSEIDFNFNFDAIIKKINDDMKQMGIITHDVDGVLSNTNGTNGIVLYLANVLVKRITYLNNVAKAQNLAIQMFVAQNLKMNFHIGILDKKQKEYLKETNKNMMMFEKRMNIFLEEIGKIGGMLNGNTFSIEEIIEKTKSDIKQSNKKTQDIEKKIQNVEKKIQNIEKTIQDMKNKMT